MNHHRNNWGIFSLAMYWLVVTSLLAPAGVLAHTSYGMNPDTVSESVHAKKTPSITHCDLDDHSKSAGSMAGCQFACDHYVDIPDHQALALQTLNTFAKSEFIHFQFPLVAQLERPPRHSD